MVIILNYSILYIDYWNNSARAATLSIDQKILL